MIFASSSSRALVSCELVSLDLKFFFCQFFCYEFFIVYFPFLFIFLFPTYSPLYLVCFYDFTYLTFQDIKKKDFFGFDSCLKSFHFILQSFNKSTFTGLFFFQTLNNLFSYLAFIFSNF